MVATGNDKYSFNAELAAYAELAAKIFARLLCICKSGIRTEMLQGFINRGLSKINQHIH